ncbi:MAG: tape measure protein [Candidatus Cloacimonetes bacterium]|nr:tape measure protein [Candidatus Cloacimonadota bacterium]
MNASEVKLRIVAEDRAKKEFVALNRTVKHLGSELGYLKNNTSQLKNATDKSKKSISAQQRVMSKLKNTVVSLALAMGIGGLAKEITNTAQSLEKTNRLLKLTIGTQKEARVEFEKMKRTAIGLKLDYQTVTEEYASFIAGGKSSKVSLEEQGRVFLAVAKSASVLQLSTDDTKGTFRALSQMMGKGVVSMEEMRQQLSERLPMAMAVTATEMGLTTAELIDFISTGSVMAEDLFPALSRGLEKTFGETAKNISGAKASLNNLRNEFTLLKEEAIKSGIMGVFETLTNLSSDFLKNTRLGIREIDKYFGKKQKKVNNPKGKRKIVSSDSVEKQLKRLKLKRSNWTRRIKELGKENAVSLRRDLASLNADIVLLEHKLNSMTMGLTKKAFSDRWILKTKEKRNKSLKSKKPQLDKKGRKQGKKGAKEKAPVVEIDFKKRFQDRKDKAKKEAERKRLLKRQQSEQKRLLKQKQREEKRQADKLKREKEKKAKDLERIDLKRTRQGDHLVDSYKTQLEVLQEQKNELTALYELSKKTKKEYISDEDYVKTTKRINQQINEIKNQGQSTFKSLKDLSKDWVDSFSDQLTNMLVKGKGSWSDLRDSMLSTISSTYLNNVISAGTSKLMSGVFGFSGGGVLKAGRVGKVGESGTEYIAPVSYDRRIFNSEETKSMSRFSSSNPADHSNLIVNVNISTGVQSTVRSEVLNLIPNITQAVSAGINNRSRRNST